MPEIIFNLQFSCLASTRVEAGNQFSMFKFLIKKIFLIMLLLVAAWLILPARAAEENAADAIAIRAMPNPEHYSPLSWYEKNIMVQGSPQSLEVDGYEAVRDGRSVYVNAANLVTDPSSDATAAAKLYTNIYIISYNQEAVNDTRDIFGQLLEYWKFNTNLIAEAGSGQCLPAGSESCDANRPCQNKDASCEGGFCVKKCLSSDECGAKEYCDSAKAKLVRDVKRLADLREMRVALDYYRSQAGRYPNLPSGTYLPDKTISVWPSWNETLGKKIGFKFPLDPVNRLGKCPDNFDPLTCWDEGQKKFATDFVNPVLPAGSLAYVYDFDAKNNRYKLCGNFETNYDGLPDIHRCDNYIEDTSGDKPRVIFGSLTSREGPFKAYFAVNSAQKINWQSLEIQLVEPPAGDWRARGWSWLEGNNFKVENTAVSNQKSISATVDLPSGKAYDFFELVINIADIKGRVGSGRGQIRICQPTTCQEAGAECGRLPDNCGGTLLCDDCPAGKDCVANKCI